MAYIDPGNLASDINQGIQAGYDLIWVTLWCTVLVGVEWLHELGGVRLLIVPATPPHALACKACA